MHPGMRNIKIGGGRAGTGKRRQGTRWWGEKQKKTPGKVVRLSQQGSIGTRSMGNRSMYLWGMKDAMAVWTEGGYAKDAFAPISHYLYFALGMPGPGRMATVS